jgi:hypothetical protein
MTMRPRTKGFGTLLNFFLEVIIKLNFEIVLALLNSLSSLSTRQCFRTKSES